MIERLLTHLSAATMEPSPGIGGIAGEQATAGGPKGKMPQPDVN